MYNLKHIFQTPLTAFTEFPRRWFLNFLFFFTIHSSQAKIFYSELYYSPRFDISRESKNKIGSVSKAHRMFLYYETYRHWILDVHYFERNGL